MRGGAARKLIAALFAVFLLTALVVYFFGDSGLLAFQGLEKYRSELVANVDDLQMRNNDLKNELSRLQTDPETNAVLARDIGLYATGEAVVRLEGRPSHSETYSVGSLLSMKKGPENRSEVFKAVALVILCLLSGYFFLTSRQARRRLHAGQRR